MAAAAALAIAGCGGGGSTQAAAIKRKLANYGTVLTGRLPAAGRPAHGGTITVGQLKGDTPTDIFPLVDAAACNTATLNFVQNQYMPLYAGPDGAEPRVDAQRSAAEPPRYSNGDRSVTINLRPNLKWSDGKPVDAQDVIFYLDLLKAGLAETPANWCQYSPGNFPDNATSWRATGRDRVVIELAHAVNPQWFTANNLQDAGDGIYPLPATDWNVDAPGGTHITDWATNPADAKRIYDYLHAQGRNAAEFASRPLWRVVDGPFATKSFTPATGAYELVPNARYGLKPRPRAAVISVNTYAGTAAELAALHAGSLDVGTVGSGPKPRTVHTLKRHGYAVFGGPAWGWYGGIFNFRDAADDFGKVIAQPYVRGALAELVDEPKIIRDVYHGWAVPAYGPAPTAPRSPLIPGSVTQAPYAYSPAKAVATLRAHGWSVKPGRESTCVKPGTSPHECGAGIPAGTPIKFVWANLPASVATAGMAESEIFATDAKRYAGIDVTLEAEPFSFLIANYNDENPAAGKFRNDWGVNNYGGVNTDFYPTQDGLMTPSGGLNMGAYADPRADQLMAASVAGPAGGAEEDKAVQQEVAYFARHQPALYMPVQDTITAVNRRIGGARKAFLAMTQQDYAFQYLYVLDRRR